ncbi:TolC family protein [Pricia sp. S334]|uniref:TolC family protein n=1 Tax=Pricia mediterranea TaxID=3076079 RepID=A0ABU3L066_9FLAO|nr:TolC family protein [Pricia sp. S334]MDT7827125.1 TolC family protein [Pricia sp. S334]
MKGIATMVSLLLVGVFVQGQQLQSYIQQAQDNNPDIRAYELRHEIAEEKVNEANWLPNTEFGAAIFASEPETRTGPQEAKFSATQMLPWFGTVSARENYARATADTEYLEYRIAKRKLALNVAQSYYALYTLKAKQNVLADNIDLLDTYERLALTAVEVNNASAVDVLRLQIRQNEMKQQKAVLQEQYLAEQANFNGLLNQDWRSFIEVLPQIDIPISDPVITDSLQLNPELTRFDKLYESVARAELLNRKESAPMLGFGLDYVPVQERSDMMPDDNGKDILMPMVSISIPIFNNQYKSRTKQNELRQSEIESQKQERLNVLRSALAKAKSERNAARIEFNTREQNIQQAKNAEEILLKNYETGTIDFDDVLDLQELQLKFQLEQVESIKKYYVESAVINYLTN